MAKRQRGNNRSRDLAVLMIVAIVVLMAVSLKWKSNYATGQFTQEFYPIKELSLFDINVYVPDEYKEIEAGHQLLVSVKLVNLGNQGRVDANLDYLIEDSINNVVLKQGETVAVETQTSFVRYFTLPAALQPGSYKISATLSYLDGQRVAVAQNVFSVVERKAATYETPQEIRYLQWSVIILFILVLVLFIVVQRSNSTIQKMVKDAFRMRKN